MYRARSRRLAQYRSRGLDYNIDTIETFTISTNSSDGCRIDNTHFALVGTNSSGYPVISTYSINPNGTDITLISSLTATLTSTGFLKIIYMDNSTLIITFDRSNNRRYIQAYTFNSSYQLTYKNQSYTTNIDENIEYMQKIDDTHFILKCYSYSLSRYVTRIYSLNTSNFTTSVSSTRNEATTIDFYENLVFLDTYTYAALCGTTSAIWTLQFFTINSSTYSITLNTTYNIETVTNLGSGGLVFLKNGLLASFRGHREQNGRVIDIISYTSNFSCTLENRVITPLGGHLIRITSEGIDSQSFINFYVTLNGEKPEVALVSINDSNEISKISIDVYDNSKFGYWNRGFKLTQNLCLGIDSSNKAIYSILIT